MTPLWSANMVYCDYCGDMVKLGQEFTSDENGHPCHQACADRQENAILEKGEK